ncbi:hypothetical protein K432DRAFT_355870 [Lepidopterella palustris CBS 459.81]|uniref:Trafficking protein particle complex subunit 11 n=1 Tax=Lepidopterella palustris CBS 459.81 TaxID=1314670 RepID=A0A8E2E847_9PEZI|nr:hypothetical protein K432DRAFT_355870 [Lepidopterella palustris CBS 459.81]
MDAYPPEYVTHNLPLVIISGLGSDPELETLPPIHDVLPGRGTTDISSELPPVTGERANQLLQEFLSTDGRDAPWNARQSNRKGSLIGYRLRAIGRDFTLPPRKADSPQMSAELSPPSSPTIASLPTWILHSPISPLSPGSPLFPDGVMTSSWVAKHQYYIPSVFISFFDFTSDANRNSLHDNQLKTEINNIKGQLQKSDYRTRYVVVLLSDKTILEAPDIEERLAIIRRATGLDPKNSLFFLPPNTSRVELSSFVHSVMSTLQPVCVEYYRDLTKHARRKKGRGQIPPPTAPPTRGTSQTLSHQGWAVRYDFKLGVLAEFRQEMDAAQRHYSFALENLFGPDGVFETTASWSPRWDEIRLLADSVALRYIRCLLWNNMPTSAAQTWLNYRAKMRDLVDRRGKGSANYGWEAWESRWAKIMAQLIQRAELPIFTIIEPIQSADALLGRANALFSPAEKTFPVGERLPPWHLLHHAGYWLKLSAAHATKRRILADEIPEEDRNPPGRSPATQVAHRYTTYDRYLVPDPHVESPLPGEEGYDHCSEIIDTLNQAASEYHARGQQRLVDQLNLDIGKALIHARRYGEGLGVLRPLWEGMSWRREGWWALVSEVTWALHECALHVQDAETLVATEWELLCKVLPPKIGYSHDLMTCLESFPVDAGGKVTVNFRDEEVSSCLSVSFTFSEGEGNVGEPLPSQIAIVSRAQSDSAPIRLSNVLVRFKGCLNEIQIFHQPDDPKIPDWPRNMSTITEMTLEETTSTASRSGQKPRWIGSSDLTIYPGQTKVFTFPITFREAGDVDALGSTFEIETDRFNLVCSFTIDDVGTLPIWWIGGQRSIKTKRLNRDTSAAIKILPKPPKMEIRLPNVLQQYYTDESIALDIEIFNKEEEDTEAVLEVRLLGRSKDTLDFSWASLERSSQIDSAATSEEDEGSQIGLPGHVVGQLARNAKRTETIKFKAPPEPSDYALEIKVLYHVLSDRDIPISKTLISDLIFVGPFEASFEFTPRIHPDPWPSFFEVQDDGSNDTTSTPAYGIAQKWHLKAKVASFAAETLIIQDMGLIIHSIHGGAVCEISKEFPSTDTDIVPQELQERSFGLDTRKLSLEERRSTAVDMSLSILWRRRSAPEGEGQGVTSTLAMPRLHMPSSEPRVLATGYPSKTVPSLIHLDYTLENPTMHFLTFEVSMDASEEFGFSGPKLRALHLLPMSRQTVHYNVLPLVRGAWIAPQLRVVDRYFNKTLKVQATDGMRLDKKGVLLWVDVEE